jgi:hypothetical protein
MNASRYNFDEFSQNIIRNREATKREENGGECDKLCTCGNGLDIQNIIL